jgi:chromosome segregation ATPase
MLEEAEAKIAHIKGELQKAADELAKLRPKVQYLEIMEIRLNGALDALQTLIAECKDAEYTS